MPEEHSSITIQETENSDGDLILCSVLFVSPDDS